MRLTEKEITKLLWESEGQYKPLVFQRLEEDLLSIDGIKPDAIIEVSVDDDPSFRALVEIVSVATPKIIVQRCNLILDYVRQSNKSDLVPLIVAPYIAGKQAKLLAEQGVSWIDLCGNMTVKIPGKIYIERIGNRNKFPDTAPIKKIFQGTSSLVSRALLLQPKGFGAQYELVDFINNLNANITAGTVSRVLKSLEEELLIRKTKSLISIIDADKLLKRLTYGYINYAKRREKKTYRFSVKDLKCVSMRLNVSQYSNYLVCGFYAAKIKGLAATDEITILVKDMEQARKEFDFIVPDAEFGNLKFIETDDSCSWFNSTEAELALASVIKVPMAMVDDIELYLEMMVDTPRGSKIAELLKPRILKGDING